MKKLALTLMIAASIGFVTTPSYALDSKKLISTLKGSAQQLQAYYTSGKDYDKITNASLRKKVQNLCFYGCSRFACRESVVKTGCIKICPDADVTNCKRAVQMKLF